MHTLLANLLVLTSALLAAQAILVTPGSPCLTKCGNVLESTSQSDISCGDDSFGAGDSQIFKGCVQCEANSHFVSPDNETDVTAALYNIRYALSSCLFGVPGKDHMLNSNPCVTSKACANFMNATIFGKVAAKDHAYQYCDLWPTDNDIDFRGCRDCLAADHHILSNFVVMLHAGCLQRPEQGVSVGVDGDPFSTKTLNITSPTPIATVDPAWFDNGPLNLNAKVGIAVGALVLLLIVSGIFIVWNGKRRRRAFLRKLDIKTANRGWPSPQAQIPTGEMFETPVSQRPLYSGWGESPTTPYNDKPFPRYVSPYSSQCNSPVAGNVPNMSWPSAAFSPVNSTGVALGPSSSNESHGWQGNLPQNKGKGNAVESFELHDVDSRGSNHSDSNSRGQYEESYVGLTESDAKRGHAF
ncbi:centromere/microtubule-binding protein cbf5 [Cordyceps javanica]|uniref:Centromere/microtubule-binding protein cbf5 n=1 Tax=Cordyceps javanica TaxID=43265 RepID=A0A545UNQ0_9HYPO|nr:centromere/microtubule-binding protein cbf5 [Cordyceps javanica]TQW02824.1 centromere/microtubule-binding protein cbf5 [Cordyceps javanica]